MAADRANQLVEAGLCLQLAGDLTGAARIWEEALRLDPANVRARRCLQALNEKALRPEAQRTSSGELQISSLGEPLGGGGGQIPTIANAPAFRAKNPFERPAQVTGNTLTPGPFALLDGTPPPRPMPEAAKAAPPAAAPQPAASAPKPASKRRNPFERPPPDPSRPVPQSSFDALLRTAGVEPAPASPPAAPRSNASYQALLATAAGAEGDKPVEPIRLTEPVIEPPKRAPAPPAKEPERAESRPAAASQIDVLLQGVRDLLDLDDHTGAHDTIEKILAIDPENAAARELLRRNEATLLAMYDSKIGDLSHRPVVQLRADEIVWLNIDHRAGFLLSMIDGTVSYDDLFALSSMSRLDTARILCQLLSENVIA